MSLRTYSLITHPRFLLHIAEQKGFTQTLEIKTDVSTQPGPPQLTRSLDIASYIGVNPDIIASIIKIKHRSYRTFSIRKRNGGIRNIAAPRTFLKVIQWWILDCILSHGETHERAFGFIKGKSFIDNAKQHLGCKHVLNVDVKDFFPSIKLSDVKLQFLKFGYSDFVASELTELVSYSGFLPQGAPTSPALSNLIMYEADKEITKLSDSQGIKYTRYADDLSFSSINEIDESHIRAVETILHRSGLHLNASKTRFMGPNQKKEITGIIIGRDDVCLSSEYLNFARGLFHKARMNKNFADQNRAKINGVYNLIAQVGGRGSSSVLKLGHQALLQKPSRPAALF